MVAELLTTPSRALDANASPYSGAKWIFYASGTTTPQAVYANAALSVSLGAEVTADAGGKFEPIYFDAALSYRGILRDSTGAVTIYDIDPINAGTLANLASVAEGKGASLIADKLPYSDTIADDQREINRDRISAMRWVPKALRAGIRDRTGTTDLTAYIQNAINAVPAGATLYFPGGLWRRDGTVTCSKTITIIGDPGHSDEDNSWDKGRGGTTFDCRHTTANAFTFSAPDTTNSRVSVTLRDFLVRGSRVSASGTTGHGIEVDGKNQAGTFVKLVMNNVHATEAPGTGLYLHGAVYGGSITDCSFFRNGKRGVLGLSEVDTTGEMLVNNLRCFQNGALAGDEEEGTGFIWLGGHIIGNLISCTDNKGSGALLGGGSIVINGLHVESNDGTAQVRLGKNGSGIVACVLTGLESSAGTDYTGAHVHITQYAKNIQLIGGFFGDTLGVGGKHILRDAGAEGLTFRGFGTSVPLVIDDNANDYQTTAVVQAFARLNTAGTNQTGDGTTVDFIPDYEVIDNYAALNIATGVFTAPFSALYRFEWVIPLTDLAAGHNTGTTFLTATSYSRTIPMGNVGAMRSAGNTLSISGTAIVPMVQGDTVKISYNVNGSTKTVGTAGGGNAGFLSVTSAH